MREGDGDTRAAYYEDDGGEGGERDGVSVGAFEEDAERGFVGGGAVGQARGEAVVGSYEEDEGGWGRG